MLMIEPGDKWGPLGSSIHAFMKWLKWRGSTFCLSTQRGSTFNRVQIQARCQLQEQHNNAMSANYFESSPPRTHTRTHAHTHAQTHTQTHNMSMIGPTYQMVVCVRVGRQCLNFVLLFISSLQSRIAEMTCGLKNNSSCWTRQQPLKSSLCHFLASCIAAILCCVLRRFDRLFLQQSKRWGRLTSRNISA